ncbi:hypothetical protein PPBDW_I10069 [Photobacterium kishitanii]|nr:hypothetical protein PPBDW_I10069 [Photobacterium kishitanii]
MLPQQKLRLHAPKFLTSLLVYLPSYFKTYLLDQIIEGMLKITSKGFRGNISYSYCNQPLHLRHQNNVKD